MEQQEKKKEPGKRFAASVVNYIMIAAGDGEMKITKWFREMAG